MNRRIFCWFFAFFIGGTPINMISQAQGTSFFYQGHLTDGSAAANGTYDFQFSLYNAPTNGDLISGPLTNKVVAVASGLFTANIDFGAVFTGTNYYLTIGVRTNGSTDAFTALQPLQPLLPVPNAIFANSASNLIGTLSAAQLSGTYSGPVSFTNTGNTFSGSFVGDGSGLTNLNRSQFSGETSERLLANAGLNGGVTSGLYAWYSASELSATGCTNGQTLFTIPDMTGNTNNTLTGFLPSGNFNGRFNSSAMNSLPGFGGLSQYQGWTNANFLPMGITNYTIFIAGRDPVQSPLGLTDLSIGLWGKYMCIAHAGYNASQFGSAQAGSCGAWFINNVEYVIYTYPKMNYQINVTCIACSSNGMDPSEWENGILCASSGANVAGVTKPCPLTNTLCIGSCILNTSLSWGGWFGDVIIFTNRLSNAQINQENNCLLSKYLFNKKSLIVTGDSQSVGVFANPSSNTVCCLTRAMPDWEVSEIGYSGWTSQQVWTNGILALSAPRWPGGSVLVVFPDFNNAGNFSEVTNYDTALIQYAKMNGYIPFLCTEWSTVRDEVVYPGYRTNYNNWVYTNWQSLGCAGIVDFSANPNIGPLGSYTNLNWVWTDQIHLNSNSYPAIVAPTISSAVKNTLY